MNELRKRARTGNDKVAGVPAAEAPELPKLAGDAAATKIAELQAELEAIKQSHEAVVDKLNAKVDALQAKNESQLREIKDLTSALHWAYAVEGIPRRHWLGRGHSEEYAGEMGNLLDGMKLSIKDLRMGTVSENGSGEKIIKIDFDLQDEDENYIRADLDESLMPYWKEFAAALRHWSEYHGDGKYLRVEIIYIELPKSVLDILRPPSNSQGLRMSISENSHHAGDMADFAKIVLQANHFITEVAFGEIKFNEEGVETLCDAIKSRNVRGHFIKILTLANCFEGGINTCTLKMILRTRTVTRASEIVRLGLIQNRMSSREAAIIAEFLNSNPSLSHLYLDENRFDDADAAVLAGSLSRNTHLRNIWIENCRIQDEGRLAFLRAIFDVSSLSSCAAANHTCRVEGLVRGISVVNSYGSASVSKWRKIVTMLALSSEDSFINTALLRGVPAQLIPLVLDKVTDDGCTDDERELTDLYLELTNAKRCQKHDVWDNLGRSKSLNCMHNLLLSWVVPSIFV
ncbi:hypothetical protein THAOC_24113 [Thalassiosira oceanica]|uniref:Uncharacterized protein n=1 Tax=Thalassiosira oceanica TaxID=159749 RepID=K0S566_THAOC|nr:hypothetical protein THAOC_24113 [Thalassiosira oceanica]|eukprot:EJK56066.1 hypothetical protein THAOC_24113 [Thalassiosira oceanica]